MKLVWLRNDLRLDDNPALHAAYQQGLAVRVIYIATPKQWQDHNEAPAKLAFRSQALKSLAGKLAERGIEFELLETESFKDIALLLSDYCLQQGVTDLWFNRETPLHEQARDQSVTEQLKSLNINCHTCNADLLVTKAVINLQGKPYKVFTPWYKAWLKQLNNQDNQPLTAPQPTGNTVSAQLGNTDLPGGSHFRDDLWPATEEAALERLGKFCHRSLEHYSEHRDFPAINGTSTLSPYLASGLVSPRRCLMAIQQTAFEEGKDWRESVWLRELGWREFYRYLMVNFSHISQGKPFKKTPEQWPWQQNPALLKAWQTGNTGFPIIDAAMRQLLSTGWMHNRLRMLVASFLCKLMLIDWREGERFFMLHLIDGDFASNNGGWQWSASTGCDASPWFRIFNPTAQSQKFDADGKFIAKFLPELAGLDNKQIHNPSAEIRKERGYAEPVIDYKAMRERAINALK
ncbi:MAG: deoxyribodipyrimidine photo-lyase [Pseudomonadales bacterium]